MKNFFALIFLLLLTTLGTRADSESDCDFLSCRRIAMYKKVCARENFSTYCWCVRDRSQGRNRVVRISVPCHDPATIFNPQTGGCTRDTPRVRQICADELKKLGYQ